MLFNRHFFIIVFSIFLIGIIFWWQSPDTAISAMAKGEYIANPYNTVKNYWKRLDYRQFDLAFEMTSDTARADHINLVKLLTENSLLSIQKVEIEMGNEPNLFVVKTSYGSIINPKKEINYLINLEKAQEGWLITSINVIP